jgi:hypothetical protein
VLSTRNIIKHSAAVAVMGVLLASGITAAYAGQATPNVTVSPDAGLADGQVVQVAGTGFQAHQQVNVSECGGFDADGNHPVCTYSTYFVNAESDSSGSVATLTFTVKRSFNGTQYVQDAANPVPATYDCAPANDCVIRVVSTTKGFARADHPITFALGA